MTFLKHFLTAALITFFSYSQAQSEAAFKCENPVDLVLTLSQVSNSSLLILDEMIYTNPLDQKFQISLEFAKILKDKAETGPDYNFWIQSQDDDVLSAKITKSKPLFETWLVYQNIQLKQNGTHEIIWRFTLNRQKNCWEVDDLISKKSGSLKRTLQPF